MARKAGERYKCTECGSQLVYEVACPCPGEDGHKEICCGKQMEKVE